MTVALVIAVVVLCNALFVAAEFAAIGAKESRIVRAAEEGNRSARLLLPVLRDPAHLDRYISACQLGITVTSIVLGAYCEHAVTGTVEGWVSSAVIAFVLVLIGSTMLQVVIGEQVPKSLALHRPNRVALLTVLPVTVTQRALGPVISFLTWTSRGVLRLLGSRAVVHRHVHSRAEIDLLMEQVHERGGLPADQHQRLQHVLELEVVTARQLMVPRNRIFAIDTERDEEDSIQRVLDGQHTRVPVYRGVIDDIVGVIHSKDLARHAVEKGCIKDWRKLVRPIVFVNEGMTGDRLLETLRERRTHQAVVMDEFGGVEGLVTLEDVLTHVFGEVGDEFSQPGVQHPQRLPDGRVRLPGRMRLEDCEIWIGVEWAGFEDTVSGHITRHLGHLPEPGEALSIDGVDVVVEGVANHVITSVVATPVAPQEEAS